MAWNQYYVMVSNQEAPNLEELLPKLGLDTYRPIGKTKLWATDKPKTLFISHYNNSLIFVHPDLPFDFFGNEQHSNEKLFVECFPDSQIAALIENSTVELFGFSIIEKGEKIRMKDGSDGEYFNDFGKRIPEEKESYDNVVKSMDEEEKEELLEDLGEEGFKDYVQFQADWGVPNLISKRFLGEYIGAIDGEKVEFIEYVKA